MCASTVEFSTGVAISTVSSARMFAVVIFEVRNPLLSRRLADATGREGARTRWRQHERR